MIFFCLLSFKFSSIFWISAINFSAVEIQMMKNSWQQNYNYHCFGIPRHVLSVTKHYISNSSWLSQNAGNGFSFSPYSLMDAFHSVIQPLESQCMVSWGRDEESEAEQSQRSEVMWCALTRFTAGGRGRKEGAAQENRALSSEISLWVNFSPDEWVYGEHMAALVSTFSWDLYVSAALWARNKTGKLRQNQVWFVYTIIL